MIWAERGRGREKLSVVVDGGRIGYKTAREERRESWMVWDQRRLRSGGREQAGRLINYAEAQVFRGHSCPLHKGAYLFLVRAGCAREPSNVPRPFSRIEGVEI